MSKMRRILVPTDGSEHARHALQFVLDLVADGVVVEVHLLQMEYNQEIMVVQVAVVETHLIPITLVVVAMLVLILQ